MPDSNDKLRPTQPYFVFDTADFRQEIYLQHGISHFFTFHREADVPLRYVPDGCLNLLFLYKEERMDAVVSGTKLKFTYGRGKEQAEIFGVRFMPAVQPAIVNVTMRQVLDDAVPIRELLIGDDVWLEELSAERDFQKRIRIFLDAYAKTENAQEKFTGKKALVQSVKQMVYDSNGKIRVSQMSAQTGYSERYINRIFLEEMGFSPKTFCKMIQFQYALDLLNYGKPENMTDAAVRMGYYDQPQFIRDFQKYAGITPGEYLKLRETLGYQERITNTGMTIKGMIAGGGD